MCRKSKSFTGYSFKDKLFRRKIKVFIPSQNNREKEKIISLSIKTDMWIVNVQGSQSEICQELCEHHKLEEIRYNELVSLRKKQCIWLIPKYAHYYITNRCCHVICTKTQ